MTRPHLDGTWLLPGDEGYDEATSPRNATAQQRPAAVARVATVEDVARCVAHARRRSLAVAVQATGHGAAGVLGEDCLLIDTSRLREVSVDAAAACAHIGAGTRWAELNAAAAPHGLLGLAGTAPDVGVVGYVLHGGWGWLTRPHGLASARLRAVEFVDGMGRVRRTRGGEDGDALWACRGGGGVGVVTAIELELVPVSDLWGGYVLWPDDVLPELARAWARRLHHLPAGVSTVVSRLRLPDAPEVPAELRGQFGAYLGAVDAGRDHGVVDALLRGLPDPLASTLGPLDATRLAAIHLDPPAAVPARGDGRFLDKAEAVPAVLDAARELGPDSPISEVEFRHVASSHPGGDGALTTSPGPLLLHLVGPVAAPEDQAPLDAAMDAVLAAARVADTGRAAVAFRDGRTTAAGALAPEDLARLARARTCHDPDGVVVRPRPVG